MAKIQCFLLREEPKETHTAIIMVKHGQKERCGDKPWHRAEIPVDADTTFSEVRKKLLPVKCMYCGQFEFTTANSEVAFSHSSHVYINPHTHQISSNYRGVATPGAMWFCPWLVEDGYISGVLSVEYLRDWLGKRPPVCVMLPNGSEWIVDQKARNAGDSGWTVTGTPPVLTASPSIDAPGYHGWLRGGYLTPVGE